MPRKKRALAAEATQEPVTVVEPLRRQLIVYVGVEFVFGNRDLRIVHGRDLFSFAIIPFAFRPRGRTSLAAMWLPRKTRQKTALASMLHARN